MTKLRRGAILAVVSAVTLAAASASGQTRSWVHNAQAGFDTGEKKSVVVTSQGDLRLARGLKTIVADDGGTAIITSLQLSSFDICQHVSSASHRCDVHRENSQVHVGLRDYQWSNGDPRRCWV